MEELRQALNNCDFNLARSIGSRLNRDEFIGHILQYAFDEDGAIAVEFVHFLGEELAQWETHCWLAVLYAMALCHWPKGYVIAYWHARLAAEENQHDPSLREFLLLFNAIPDKLLSDDEAKAIARGILADGYESKTAQTFVKN